MSNDTTRSLPCACSPLSYEIYETALKDGVSPDEIDVGSYNRFGILVGRNDGVVDEPELEIYLYKHWQKYQLPLYKKLSLIVPWALDDLDPKTHFDEKVRSKTKKLIESAHAKASKKKIAAKSPEFQIAVIRSIYEEALADPFFFAEFSSASVKQDDDPKFDDYGCPAYEKTVKTSLESLETKTGVCTEYARVLMGIYSMAGFNTRAINVTTTNNGEWVDHVALQVEAAPDKWITIDPIAGKFDPQYEAYIPLSNAEFAGLYYREKAFDMIDRRKANISYSIGAFLFARSLIPSTAEVYFANNNTKVGMEILRRFYTDPDDPRPELIYLNYLKRVGREKDYTAFTEEIRKKYPNIFAMLENNVLNHLFNAEHGAMIKAKIDILSDLAKTPEDKKEIKFIKAMYSVLSDNPKEAYRLTGELIKRFEKDELLLSLYTYSLCRSADFDKLYSVLKRLYSRLPKSEIIRLRLMKVSFSRGDYDTVIDTGNSLLKRNKLPFKALLCLVTAYVKSGDIKGARQALDKFMSSWDVAKNKRRNQYILIRAALALAEGNVDRFKTLYRQVDGNDLNSIAGIFGIINLYVTGKKEEAVAKKEELLKTRNGMAKLKYFQKYFGFIENDAMTFLGSFAASE